jgi:hypothetical protein
MGEPTIQNRSGAWIRPCPYPSAPQDSLRDGVLLPLSAYGDVDWERSHGLPEASAHEAEYRCASRSHQPTIKMIPPARARVT